MKKRIPFLIVCALLTASLLLSGCGLSVENVMNVIAPSESPAPGSDLTFEGVSSSEKEEPLQLTYETMNGVFNPLWASSDGDRTVVRLTQLSLLGSNAAKAPAAITREDNEDGSVSLTIRLEKGILCSDGVELTADDLLFDYYVLLDSDYDGPYELMTVPVRGLPAYWNGMDTDLYAKYVFLYDSIYRNGKYDQELQNQLSKAEESLRLDEVPEDRWMNNNEYRTAKEALDNYDAEKADEIRTAIQQAWRQDADELVEYVMSHYSATITMGTSYTLEEIWSNVGLQVMCTMRERLFGQLNDDGSFTGASGSTWDLKNEFPTTDDLFDEMYAAYQGDAEQYWLIEGIGRPSMLAAVENRIIKLWAAEDEYWTGGVDFISGIEKLDNYTLRITVEYFEAPMERILTDIMIAPLHVYGDVANFDPGRHSFGLKRGDLRSLRTKYQAAIGAGEYAYDHTDIRTVYLVPNEHYWLGERWAKSVVLSKG